MVLKIRIMIFFYLIVYITQIIRIPPILVFFPFENSDEIFDRLKL